MRALLLLASSGLLLGAHPPQDPTVKQQRYDMGVRVCAKVMDDELPGIAGAPYRDAVDSADWERAEYCHCVGEEFADDPNDRFGLMTATGDDAAKAMFAKIEDALQSCMPGSGNMADLAD